MRALAVGCGYKSGRPDPDILSHREPCCRGAASLAAGEPLTDSGTLALAMLFCRPRGRADPCSRRSRRSGLLPVRVDLGNLDVRCLHRRYGDRLRRRYGVRRPGSGRAALDGGLGAGYLGVAEVIGLDRLVLGMGGARRHLLEEPQQLDRDRHDQRAVPLARHLDHGLQLRPGRAP